MASSNRRPTSASIDLETLEPRQLLAAFGTPWPEPRELTISFPADGVQVGTFRNDIAAKLDQIADRQQWQELSLRALQTWAIHADINIGLRNDHNLDFGTPGLIQSDPRFGDFRIGAFPQVGLLANSLPFQVAAGTYSGDILLNSNQQFRYHDWEGGIGPDLSQWSPDQRDLFSLLLHESGNTLGLNDNAMDWTVMFQQYTVPKGLLSQEDIDGIQSLYGARTDPYEQIDNGQLNVATLIPTPVGFHSSRDVIRTRASLVDATDVDYFRIDPIADQGSVSIRLRAAGISLLNSRLEVLDEAGQVLQSGKAGSVFSNDIVLNVSQLQNHSALYLRVSALDPSNVYSVGDYELEIDYRHQWFQSLDAVTSAYDAGPDALFANYSLLDWERGSNDSLGDAVSIDPTAYGSGNQYAFTSSVSSRDDIDYWKVTAPDTVNDRLVVTVAGVGLHRPDVRVEVRDANGRAVGASGRLRSDGTWVMEVAQPQANQDYYLRMSVDPTSAVGIGNYVATAEFVAPIDQMNQLVSGDVDSKVDDFVRWTAGKTKLFRFDLKAEGASAGEGVKLTIYDAHTREVRLVIATPSNVTRTAFAWLPQGEYIIRIGVTSQSANSSAVVRYSLMCDGISDDQDEDDEDPGNSSDYDPYAYYEDPNTDPYGYYEYDTWYRYYYTGYYP